ncbi:MAG TPA: PQQ-binding-like beta-propeller repeat protein [Verrucomicrobiae bacterium]|nr:PQQ-binding-like beta-propeller repeat protein [Verrucomicrobiae bacterium]
MNIDQIIRILIMALSLLGTDLLAKGAPGTVLWSDDLGNAISSSPTLATDGTVYLGTAAGLVAVTNFNSVVSNRWSFGVAPSGSPAVGADGTIYFCGNGNLYALDPEGVQKWVFQTTGATGGSPAVGSDQTIYFDGSYFLYAVTSSGTLKWKSAVAGTGSFRSPAIGPDGTVYIASGESGQFYAIKPDGTQRWAASGSADSAAIAADGRTYITGGPLYAYARDGSMLWSTPSAFSLDGPPIIGVDGSIYVAAYQSHVLSAFTSQGQSSWQGPGYPSRGPGSAAVTDAGGAVYYCVSNSVWALNSNGQVQWAVTSPDNPIAGFDLATTAPIIGSDGAIYAALGTKIFAIVSGTNGAAKSSWPMYKQNSRHTGSLQGPILNQPQKRGDANFQFQLYPQQLGLTYAIESSTNLNTWTSLTSFVATSLPMPVTDLSASNSPSKFYRAYSSQ